MNLQIKYSIQEYFNKEEYLKRTLIQIIKDFEMSGATFEGDFSDEISYQALLNLVFKNVVELFQGSSSQLKNILYRIDISEKVVQQNMSNKEEEQMEEVISQLIIERCMIKVLIKEKYSES